MVETSLNSMFFLKKNNKPRLVGRIVLPQVYCRSPGVRIRHEDLELAPRTRANEEAYQFDHSRWKRGSLHLVGITSLGLFI
jgi:hypothetical protein